MTTKICFFQSRDCNAKCKAYNEDNGTCRVLLIASGASEGLYANVDVASVNKRAWLSIEPLVETIKQMTARYQPLLEKAVSVLERDLDNDIGSDEDD